MRLSIRILGCEVFGFSTDPEPLEDVSRDLSGGTTYSSPISLTWTRGDGFGDRPEYDD